MLFQITLLSILSLVLFAVSDYAIGRSGRGLNPHIVNFLLQAFSFIVVVPIVVALGLTIAPIDALMSFTIGIAFAFGFYYYVRAMSRGPIGVATPIVNAYAIVTLVAGVLLFGVTMTPFIIGALALVAIGAVLLVFSKDMLKGKLLHSTTAKLAVASMLIQGFAFAFLTPIIQRSEWHDVLFFMALGTLVATAVLFVAKFARRWKTLKSVSLPDVKVATIAGLLTGLGAVVLFMAGGLGNNIVLPSVLSAASPLITCAIAFFLDGERLSLVNRIGAVVVVAGMIILNL